MNKSILIFLPALLLACSLSSRLPVHAVPKAVPVTSMATQAPAGHVVAPVNVRNTPEANGNESHVVDSLLPGVSIEQTGPCVTVGNSVWVQHAAGWSVVRNRQGVYITGVCK